MADLLAGVDFAADFANWAQGLRPVTIETVDPDTGEVLTISDVPAARLITKPTTVPARGGEVGVTGSEFWFTFDPTVFEPKTRDRITEADGTVWILDEAQIMGGGGPNVLTRCPVTRAR